MTDSLVIGESIELIGSVASTNPLCAGAVFLLQPGYDLSAPQPVTSVIGSLLLDGSRPFGYQAGNRTITLPVEISVPGDSGTPAGFQTLTAAREVLLREINQQTWTLRWTRDPGTGTALPLLFDCFRAHATVVAWGGVDQLNRFPVGLLTLTFEALPYGRTDVPVVVDFPQALAGRTAPPPAVTVDSFSSVSGTQWAASAQSPVAGGQSAFWDPTVSPANIPSGTGVTATYSKTGLSVNMAQGWTGIEEGTGTTTQLTLTTIDAGRVGVGDQFQLAGNVLGGDNTNFEGGGTGSWNPQVNCSITNTTAQAHGGTHSLQLSSTAAGAMSVINSGNPQPCLPGDTAWASAWLRAATVPEGCQVGVLFTDVNFNTISTGFGSGGATPDSASAWTQVTTSLGVIAPAGAAFAETVIQVNSTGGAAEVHYVDDVVLACRSSVLLQTQIFTVTNIGTPSLGFVPVTFTPAAAGAPVTGNVAIQTGPPRLSALTLWAGFGSTLFHPHWGKLGGRVTFAVTLTDTYSTTLSFSRTVKASASNSTMAPRWNKIRIPVPYKAGFDYGNVASYSITVTNRGTGDLRFTQLYLSQLLAVPPPVTVAPSPARGTVYELAGLPGTARAPVSLQFQQTGSRSYVQQFTTAGTHTWTCPPGVSSVSVFAIGGGGAGANFNSGVNGGGGGGGGGSAANASVAVTAGNTYTLVVGTGGIPNWGGQVIFTGSPATDSTFTGDSVTVTAHHGVQGTISAGGAGGAAGTGGFAGGTGGAGTAATTGGGGAGGGSGGTGAGGNNGGAASGGTGGVPGAAVAGGGIGGRGGTKNIGNGGNGGNPGGGAGGSPGGASGNFGHGGAGLVQLTYTSNSPGFQTLIAHRPPVTAPDTLLPFVSPSPADALDGSTQYPVQSLVPGLNARFGGTYTVVLSMWAWHTTNVSRTLTVTVTQFEQPGGAAYTSSVSTSVVPNTLVACSGTNANFSPLIVLGELTLPVQDLPQDNKNAYFTVSVTSTDTADQAQDVLFLDTTGSTVIIQSPTTYAQMFVDAPGADRDLGLIMGSLYDRDDAVSILDRAIVAGGPITADPDGNPHLLVYAAEGAPNLQLSYFPCWHLDRIT